MAKKEATTDLWVHDLLKEAGIGLDAQGSSIKEIDDALKSASKRGTGKAGFPEYVGVVKDFVIVIEDKADLKNHIKENENGGISDEISDITNYAVNGALFYAKHLVQNTNFEKVIAIGVSGDKRRHKITPLYVEDTEPYTRLNDVESFINFNEKNIQEFYEKEILHEDYSEEKLKQVLKDASDLHEELRIYGSLGTREKPIVVSGILLALDEISNGNFSIESLVGDKTKTDGEKIYDAIKAKFERNPIKPEKKRDKVLSQFNIIKNSEILNSINKTLAKTPLKRFAEFLNEKIYKSIKYTISSEDYLGRFYSEFMSYGGGDGQDLGIILTPQHITDLFCDLVDIKKDDTVLDPCCGTGGFLISAMYHMLEQTEDETEKLNIRQKQLHGIEIEEYMFTIAVTNMILRGDGKSNIENSDFLNSNSGDIQRKGASIGMINPPYSMAKKKKNAELYEINFIKHMLDSLIPGGKGIAIVPQSSMTGKTNEEQQIKESILKNHTLEGVIMLQKDTFYGIGVIPCIAVFTSGQPHPKDKICKFINFEDDGFKVSPHVGLLETEAAKDKKQHLLDVWFDRIEAENKFCVKTTVNAQDEWLHSFYYFNDEIPTDADFEKTVGDYLSFEFSMIMQGRRYLFENVDSEIEAEKADSVKKNFKLSDREWKEFRIGDLFDNFHGKRLTNANRKTGNIPFLTASEINQGVTAFLKNEKLDKYKDSITIDMFGHVFFHNYECSGDDNIYFFISEKLSNTIKRFISQCMQNSCYRFSYGKQFRQKFADKLIILLPVSENGEPDFDFMENYIHELEQEKLSEYKTYAQKQLSKLYYQEIEPLENKEWKDFYINEIFLIKSGKRLTKRDMKMGNRPFIGASSINNGITNFVSNINSTLDKNVLGVNYNGSVGECFYHKYDCIFSDDVKRFHLKYESDNQKLFLFMKTLILFQKVIFTYGYKFNENRMLQQKIMLPITSDEKPDYAYMEQYTKNLMLRKYCEYLDYKFKKSQTIYSFSAPYFLVAEKS